ncbi:MAG: PHP domain-containing protein, partial [Clostridiales bacterium]|nr:PHP domain-containing protein [Clostridiales bacterium]
LRLTEKYHLRRTGGSDFHGERVKPDVELAALELELDWLLDG